MKIQRVGKEDPFATSTVAGRQGIHVNGAVSVYPSVPAVVVSSGSHGDCYNKLLGYYRGSGVRPSALQAVHGTVLNGSLLVRRDHHEMADVFKAVEILEEEFPDHIGDVRYLGMSDPEVRTPVRERGELWRINPAAHTKKEMVETVNARRRTIDKDALCYYNPKSGTRYLTRANVKDMLALPEDKRQACLAEIVAFCDRKNSGKNPELVMFNADFQPQGSLDQIMHDFDRHSLNPSVTDESTEEGTAALYQALTDHAPVQEELLGLCPEFKMKLRWLAGASVKEGVTYHHSCGQRPRAIVQNIVANTPHCRFVNLASIPESNSKRQGNGGRREVYFAEAMKEGDRLDVEIIRMQDYDEWQYLDEGNSPREAKLRADEHSRFRTHCRNLARKLGMEFIDTRPGKLTEEYRGLNAQHHGLKIEARYLVREYIRGIVTDKVSSHWMGNPVFVKNMVKLLGRAAAANMVVGRAINRGKQGSPEYRVLFNDGDEYLHQGPGCIPDSIVVGDPTGCLEDAVRSFKEMRPEYETKMMPLLTSPQLRDVFITSLLQRYQEIRDNCILNPKYRADLDKFLVNVKVGDPYSLSLHSGPGSFIDRKARVLARLEGTTPEEFARIWS